MGPGLLRRAAQSSVEALRHLVRDARKFVRQLPEFGRIVAFKARLRLLKRHGHRIAIAVLDVVGELFERALGRCLLYT